MEIAVCVKRVPAPGGTVTLSEDEKSLDARNLGFTIGPHEECAIEEATRLAGIHGGRVTVLTVGPDEALEQLRAAMSFGADRGVHVRTEDGELGPVATATALAVAIRDTEWDGGGPDLVLLGNEAPDSADYQVGIRLAHVLDLPCLTGLKSLQVDDAAITGRREAAGGWDVFAAPRPAVVTVREGLNTPRYPSLPGRLRAKKRPVQTRTAVPDPVDAQLIRLRVVQIPRTQAELLATGPDLAGELADLLETWGVLA
ncbi:MAG: electron transfer flavoprotein subunit beta/FixA family protein [Actinomycetes bacterium]